MAVPELKHAEQPREKIRPYPRPPIDREVPSDFGLCIPYYDEELGVGHGEVHEHAVWFLSTVLRTVARERDLVYHSDYPVRYIDHRNNKQKQFYPDFLLARADTPKKVTADDLLFVLEVVSTDDRRKERKDTVVMRALNEYNEVDEFVLYFPDIEDDSIESPGY